MPKKILITSWEHEKTKVFRDEQRDEGVRDMKVFLGQIDEDGEPYR